MLQIEVDYELADKIILANLKQAIEDNTRQVKELCAKSDNLKPYQIEDLNYSKNMLLHLEAVYEYYGGNIC